MIFFRLPQNIRCLCSASFHSNKAPLHTSQRLSKIPGAQWTNREEVLLQEGVSIYGNTGRHGEWQKIAEHVGSRTSVQCMHKWSRSMNPNIRHGRWTEKDKDRLMEAVQAIGEGNWRAIADMAFSGARTPDQCRQRYTQIKAATEFSHGRWTEIEDQMLTDAVEAVSKKMDQNDSRFWRAVQKQVGSRDSLQCRQRWTQSLCTKALRRPWTTEETVKLLDLVDQYGNVWSKIQLHYPDRTARQLSAKWHAIMKSGSSIYAISKILGGK